MTLRIIANNSNIFTDENFSDANIISLANKAISRINTECKTKFPFYEEINTEYIAIPTNWQLDLISNYISYGVKMNDSSVTEADRYLDEFYKSLNNFKDNIGTLVDNGAISSDYIDTNGFGGVYGIDTSGAINIGFFGSNGNGGSY